MKRTARKTAAIVLAAAAALFAPPAGAIEPGWTAGPMSATGDSICTNGTLVYAYSVIGGTVGGVTFTRAATFGSEGMSDVVSASSSPAGSAYGSLMDAGAPGNYGQFLSNGWYWDNGTGDALAFTLSLSGLTAGKTYLVQLVVHRQSNSMTVSANGTEAVHVHGDNEASYKYGASLVGVFTASAATENVAISFPTGSSQRPINAIQVRELPSDEPEEKPVVIFVK